MKSAQLGANCSLSGRERPIQVLPLGRESHRETLGPLVRTIVRMGKQHVFDEYFGRRGPEERRSK